MPNAIPAKILVLFESKTGHVRKMAEAVAEGVVDAGGAPLVVPAAEFESPMLLDFQGYVVGAPTYYGLPPASIKQVFDDSVVVHGRLAGRVGAAFASSANTGGGNETTCLAILQMMLVHGMLTLGSAQGDHYGPVSVGEPTAQALAQCRVHGGRVAKFARRLAEARLRDGKVS